MKTIQLISTTEIIPGDNDRTIFDQGDLNDLARSIKEMGLIQPITVRIIDNESTDPMYAIVAGERRFRACQLINLTEIPVIVEDLTDEEASTIMLSENVSRADLDPIDEANAYQKRINAFGWSVAEIAEKAGVTQVRVQFRLKLLRLRSDLQLMTRSGNLSLGYAQIIASANLDPNFQTIAIAALRDNTNPTPTWFRRICGELSNKQAQSKMFDDALFTGKPVTYQPVETLPDPPHPSTTTPPTIGGSHREIITNQIGFWEKAASLWDLAGKPFKRQECQSAAQALNGLLITIL